MNIQRIIRTIHEIVAEVFSLEAKIINLSFDAPANFSFRVKYISEYEEKFISMSQQCKKRLDQLGIGEWIHMELYIEEPVTIDETDRGSIEQIHRVEFRAFNCQSSEEQLEEYYGSL